MSETTNIQLEKLASKLGINLILCCSKDQLNLFPFQYGGYIINLADSNQEGTHWVSFYTEKGKDSKPKAAYYDSFGCPPPIAVQRFLNNCVPYAYSNGQIQNISSGYCGIYCLYFIDFMQNNKRRIKSIDTRYDAFLHKFDDDEPEKNLRLLKKHIDQIEDATGINII